MRSKLAVIVISLLVALGTSTAACSSDDAVPDDQPTEAPTYEPADGAEYEEYETGGDDQPDQQQAQPPTGEQQQQQPGQQPMPGQPTQPDQGEMPEATGPVATVDGQQIPAEEFNEQIEQLQQQAPHIPPQQMGQMQGEIIDQLVQQKLIEQAIEESDVEVSDEQVEARLDELRREFEETSQAQFGQDMDFEDFVAQMGMTAEELDEVIRETVAIEQMLEKRGHEMPTDEDVREFYEENPEIFTEPEHIEARQLIIPVDPTDPDGLEAAEETAEEVHRRVTEEDEDFEEVAQDYENVQAQESPIGRQPPQDPQQPQQPRQPEEIEETAFETLEDGEISEPISTQQGVVIIQRLGHQEEGVADFEEVEEQLEHQLRNQAMEESLDEFLSELEAEADIERHPENIQ